MFVFGPIRTDIAYIHNVAYIHDKTNKLFFSASERPRMVLNAFLECMYFDKMTVIYAYMDVAYMDGQN